MRYAGRLFMKQFLLKQTMHDANEPASGGSYFIDIASWILDLNHILIADQPSAAPLLHPCSPSSPIFASFSLSLSFSALLSFSLQTLSTLCIVSRNYSQTEPRGNSGNSSRLLLKAFIRRLPPLHLFHNPLVIGLVNIPFRPPCSGLLRENVDYTFYLILAVSAYCTNSAVVPSYLIAEYTFSSNIAVNLGISQWSKDRE